MDLQILTLGTWTLYHQYLYEMFPMVGQEVGQ